MTPITDEAAVTAVDMEIGYPSFFMAGINIEPIPAVSALVDPEIPAKSILAIILT